MSSVAQVVDGKIVQSASQTSVSNSATTKSANSNDTVNKDQFLQLLVAQMKYQDPMEPTSNTEYISQYATFSELEQMQNMCSALELSRASALVGETVIMKVTDASGNTRQVQGNVDYVSYEGNKAYLYINGEAYSMDDLDTVVDQNFLDAYDLSARFLTLYNKLPNYSSLTLEDKDQVMEIYDMYSGMSNYEQKFIESDIVNDIKKYKTRIDELTAQAEENGDIDTPDEEDTSEPEESSEA